MSLLNNKDLARGSMLSNNRNRIYSLDMKFVGGNLDKKTNKITLNFVKNSHNSFTNNPMTPGYSKSNHGVLSCTNHNNIQIGFFKNNLYNKKDISNNNNFCHTYSIENEASNYEPCDDSILRYMVDIDFFDEKNKNKDYSIIKKLIGNNVKVGKMDNEGFMEILPVMQKYENKNGNENNKEDKYDNYNNFDNEYNNNKNNENKYKENFKFDKKQIAKNSVEQENYINNSDNENFNKIYFYKEMKKNNEGIGFNICNLDDLLNDYKYKLEEIESKTIMNPFDFVKNNYKKDYSIMNVGVIIEGNAIMQCLDGEIFPIFWEVISKSRSVICCRCSPNFKSNLVEFVKKMSGDITMAIGDGGNDVNMLKSANIGVGIFGKEGHQAAYNSDYAISQFKYLERLLFFHGRYSLIRNSYFINFFFFKNLIFTFPQFWFAFFSGFSGALLWDDWYYLGYNSYLSTFPAGAKMLFDEDIDITFENYKDKHLVEL
jgi:hypothetical protein